YQPRLLHQFQFEVTITFCRGRESDVVNHHRLGAVLVLSLRHYASASCLGFGSNSSRITSQKSLIRRIAWSRARIGAPVSPQMSSSASIAVRSCLTYFSSSDLLREVAVAMLSKHLSSLLVIGAGCIHFGVKHPQVNVIPIRVHLCYPPPRIPAPSYTFVLAR